MGTRFLMTKESAPPEHVKARYVKAGTDDIVVSTKVDGLPQRMIRNKLLNRIEAEAGLGIWKRGVESGLAMKKLSGASFGDLFKAAQGMRSHGGLTIAQAMTAAAAPMMIQKAVVDGDADNGLMATGLVAGRLGDLPSCQDLIASIVAEARERIAALTGVNALSGAA
jgi:NAD(P)H-dependent flavin oxidoreductase YrpB (nitropropane dioxygenase family)